MAPKEILVQLNTDSISEKRELSQRIENTLEDNWNNTYSLYSKDLDNEY